MEKEKAEKRDFLPDFFAKFIPFDRVQICLEKGYGQKLGYTENDYLRCHPGIRFVDKDEVYQQDLVVVIRSPELDVIKKFRPNTGLVSMLHYETRPLLLRQLKEQQIHSFSLDAIVDDDHQRQVVTYEMTAFAGIHSAFSKLTEIHEQTGFSTGRPLKVAILGMGNLGVRAARYAYSCYHEFRLFERGVKGIRVEFLEKEITGHSEVMQNIFRTTDLLVDATKRPDSTVTIISNEWIGYLPEHAVILDLTADPYAVWKTGVQVKAIEGIPNGTLDKYVFEPNDPEWDAHFADLPPVIRTKNRRVTVSCNAWPGVKPKECMEEYGKKIFPYLTYLLTKGFACQADSEDAVERALARSTITYFETRQL